jgi:hypothetical protein
MQSEGTRLLLRFVNTSLFTAILILTITGALGLVFPLQGWLFELHRIMGWAVVVLTPWKSAISWRSLRRGPDRRFDRSWGLVASGLLTGLSMLVIAFGLAWMWRLGPKWLRLVGYTDTLISWHWILGFTLLPLFALHAWRSWPRPKWEDFKSRRGALHLAGLGLSSVGLWLAGNALAALREHPEEQRRISGSREQASFEGNAHPVTTGAGDGEEELSLEDWRLRVSGAVERTDELSFEDLSDLPEQGETAILDCTIGWYTVQEWSGVRLRDLLKAHGADPGALAVRVIAHSGYAHLFPTWEIDDFILATHVSGEPLAHRHGAPLRLVAPGRRGWFWVKWVREVQVISPRFEPA